MNAFPVLNFQDFIASDNDYLSSDSIKVDEVKKYIYVMKSGSGLVKVGISINPEARRAVIETGNGFEVKIIKLFGPVRGAVLVERAAHNMLSSSRRGGEWFSCSSEDAINAVTKAIDSFIEPEITSKDSNDAVREAWRIAQSYMAPAFAALASEAEMLGKYEKLVDSFGELTKKFVEAAELVDFYADSSETLLEINKALVTKVKILEDRLTKLEQAQAPLRFN